MKVYKDRKLLAENNDLKATLKEMGQGLVSCLGKSFSSEDAYFQGAFDNVEIYNYAKTAADISYVETVSVTYHAKEGGAIEGRESQRLIKGNSASKVKAVPEPDWRFVRWSDGEENPERQELMVKEILQSRLFLAKNPWSKTALWLPMTLRRRMISVWKIRRNMGIPFV